MPSEDPGAPGVLVSNGGPRRLHVLSPVFFAIGHAWRLWPLAVILAARRQFWLLAAGALVLLAWSTVEWLRRTYSLEGGALRLEEGVLARKLRAVPFDRIQQVDLVRKPLHRLLGVATLRVETAGGGSAAEVDLDVVTLPEAQSLRTSLLRAKAQSAPARSGLGTAPAGQAAGGAAEADVAGGWVAAGPGAGGAEVIGAEVTGVPAERVLLRLPLGEVMLAGITGSRAAAALVVLGPLSQAADWFPGLDEWVFQRFDPEAVTPTTPAAFLAVAVLAAVVWLGLAAASSIVTDYGFTLARVGNDLVVRRGLLERREAHLPLARLQVVRIEESLLRRALGLASIRIQSAGRTGTADQSAGRLAIPILQRMQVNRVLNELVAGAAPVPRLLAPPPAARRRSVTRSVVGAGVLVAAVALPVWVLTSAGVLEVPPAFALAALPVLGVAVAVGLAAYRSLGHATGEGFLYARAGVAIRVLTVVPVAKAQSGSVRSSPFQRRAGLATLHVDIAGGGPTPQVHDESEPRAEDLLQVILGRRVVPGPSAAPGPSGGGSVGDPGQPGTRPAGGGSPGGGA
ncbi:MAG TPA: PH domain-containing protein [Actinomycetota bacterium]|nr:PH domain-containing protein [Actinomycetota bacterium]